MKDTDMSKIFSLGKSFEYCHAVCFFMICCFTIILFAKSSYGDASPSQLPFKGTTKLIERKVPVKPFHTTVGNGVYKELIVVKFVEGTDIRLRDGKLVSLQGSDLAELSKARL